MLQRFGAVGAMLVSSILLTGGADAQSGEAFYRGKTVNIVVGYAPGGGYDIYSRLLSRHLGRLIEGAPTVLVQNMPGAAGVVASNYVYVLAPKDGTMIAAVDQNVPMFQILGGKGAQYDITKVSWLGSMASSNGIALAWHASGVHSLSDALEREVSIGTTGANDDAYVYARALNALVGAKFKIIQGYSGTSNVNVALENGEVQAMGRSSYYGFVSQRPDWLRDKKVDILVQLGLEKQPELPDVPLLTELPMSDADRRLAALVSMPTSIGYSHWTAPQAPAERVKELQKAYDATLKDPELLAEAKKLGIEIRPKTATQMKELVDKAVATPDDIRARATKLLGWD